LPPAVAAAAAESPSCCFLAVGGGALPAAVASRRDCVASPTKRSSCSNEHPQMTGQWICNALPQVCVSR
jgi:hypothetical protein